MKKFNLLVGAVLLLVSSVKADSPSCPAGKLLDPGTCQCQDVQPTCPPGLVLDKGNCGCINEAAVPPVTPQEVKVVLEAAKPSSLVRKGVAGTRDFACVPACRKDYTCLKGKCVTACNPPCGKSEVCKAGECVLAVAAPGPMKASGSAEGLVPKEPVTEASGQARVPQEQSAGNAAAAAADEEAAKANEAAGPGGAMDAVTDAPDTAPPPREEEGSGHTTLWVVIGTIAAVAIAGGVGYLIYDAQRPYRITGNAVHQGGLHQVDLGLIKW